MAFYFFNKFVLEISHKMNPLAQVLPHNKVINLCIKRVKELALSYIQNNNLAILKSGDFFGFYIDKTPIGFMNSKGDVFILKRIVGECKAIIQGTLVQASNNSLYDQYLKSLFEGKLNVEIQSSNVGKKQ
jgi:hypothetical protein